jgi:hypothetical protein
MSARQARKQASKAIDKRKKLGDDKKERRKDIRSARANEGDISERKPTCMFFQPIRRSKKLF